jgi:hypothetical protein
MTTSRATQSSSVARERQQRSDRRSGSHEQLAGLPPLPEHHNGGGNTVSDEDNDTMPGDTATGPLARGLPALPILRGARSGRSSHLFYIGPSVTHLVSSLPLSNSLACLRTHVLCHVCRFQRLLLQLSSRDFGLNSGFKSTH